MRPQFKDVRWERVGPDLRLVYDTKEQLLIEDADVAVENLLELLREGGREPAELAGALKVPVDDVMAAVELLDSHRLLEDGDRLGRTSPSHRERYFSNLAFFEPFATLACSREDMHEELRRSHVLVLGTGGLNSNTIPHLCGMGVADSPCSITTPWSLATSPASTFTAGVTSVPPRSTGPPNGCASSTRRRT